MPKKRSAASETFSTSNLRGVETFDTNDTLLLALGGVEDVARAFTAQKQLKTWRQDALGETVTLNDPSYLVLRLAGHEWSIIVACVFSRESFLKATDANTLSAALKRKVIYFGNSDTSSVTEYELFESGKSLERFYCYEDVEFKSTIRDVDPPEDGPEIYDFVSGLVRDQGAFVPACSIYFQSGWLKKGQKFTLAGGDEIQDDMIERMDYLA